MLKKSLKNNSLIIIIVIITFAIIFRYVYINNKYPAPNEILLKTGNTLVNNNVHVLVKSAELKSITSVLNDFDTSINNLNEENLTKNDIKVLLVTLEISNDSKSESIFPLYAINAESYGWSNGASSELYSQLNSEKSLNITLSPNEKKEIMLPLKLYSIQFSNNSWKKINHRDFFLVFSTYPQKIYVSLFS